MKSSKSANEFRGSQLSLKSQNSSPNRRCPTSSSRNRSSRSESTRSLSSSSSRELVTSSLTSPAALPISSKAAAVTSRLYPRTDGGFDYLKKGFYDVRFNENLKTRPPCDCHQGKSRCDESNAKHSYLRKSSSTPRFAGCCGSSCVVNSTASSTMRKSATARCEGKGREDASCDPAFRSSYVPKDLDDGSWRPCERWRSHSGDAERRLRLLDDISRRSAESRRTRRQASSNASDSESSSPDGGRTSSLAGYAVANSELPGFREAVRIIGGAGNDDGIGETRCAPRRPRLNHIADQRGLSTSSSIQLVSSSASSSSAPHHRHQEPRRRRPFVRSLSTKEDSRASSSMSGRSSSLSGFRSRSSSQLSYHDESPFVVGEDEISDEKLIAEDGRRDFYSRCLEDEATGSLSRERMTRSRSSNETRATPKTRRHHQRRLVRADKTLKNRFSKMRRHPLRKLLRRPHISIKKRTLFLSYAVTHGSGVLVSGREVARRTGFAQINSLGKLVSNWCRMSDSELSDSPFGDSQSCDGQNEESQLGGDGTLVPNDGSKNGGQLHLDVSSDEASPLRSETEVTIRDDDDDDDDDGGFCRTRSSSSGQSCEKDSLCDDDAHDNEEDGVGGETTHENGTSLGRSRHSSGLSESSIEVGRQSYGYNDGFLLQSFLSRSFNLENYRYEHRPELMSPLDGQSVDSDEASAGDYVDEERAHYEALGDVFRQDAHSFPVDAPLSKGGREGRGVGGNGGGRGFSSQFHELPVVPSFVQRRNDSLNDPDRHLAEYTIAYEEDQSAPLHLRQYGDLLGQVILEQSLSEIGSNGSGDGAHSLTQIAEELTQNVMSAALSEVAKLTTGGGGVEASVGENLDQISARMSDKIIKDSEECIMKIIDFADQVSRNVVSASLEYLSIDLRQEGDGEGRGVKEGVDRTERNVERNGVVSWTMSSDESFGNDPEEDSIERAAEEEESVEVSDLPSPRDDANVTTADACVGDGDFLEELALDSTPKHVTDAYTQTCVGEVGPSPALDGRYLENQWYPISDNDEENQQQNAVIGLWKAFSQELESNSKFLNSEELLDYFSGGSGGVGDAVNESSSISLREHLQSQLTSSENLSIPQTLETNSVADAFSVNGFRNNLSNATSQWNGSRGPPDKSSDNSFADDDVNRASSCGLVKNGIMNDIKRYGVEERGKEQSSRRPSPGGSNPDVLSLSSYADLPPRLSTVSMARPSNDLAHHLNTTMDASLSTTTEDERDDKDGEEASRLFFVDSDEDLEQRVARILNDTHDDMVKWKRDAKRTSSMSTSTSALSGSRRQTHRRSGQHNVMGKSPGGFGEVIRKSSSRHRTLTDSSVEPVSSSFASTSLESLPLADEGKAELRPPGYASRRAKKKALGSESDGFCTEEEMLRRMISSTDRILRETLESDSDFGSQLSKETTRKEDSGIFSTKCSVKKTKKSSSAYKLHSLVASPRPLSVPHLAKDRSREPYASTPYSADAFAKKPSSAYKLDLSQLDRGLDSNSLTPPRGALSARPKLETAFDEDELIVKARSSLQDGFSSVAPSAVSATLPRVRSHYDRLNTPKPAQYSVPENPTIATLTKSFVALPSAHWSQKSKHLSPKEHRIILANIRKSLVEASKDLDRIS